MSTLPRCAASLLRLAATAAPHRLAAAPRHTAALASRRVAPRLRAMASAAAAAAAAAAPPSPAVVCYVTAPSEAVATALSRALVSAHLAACVNIVPGVRSVYFWEGKVCEDAELLLIIKTRAELVGAARVCARVRSLHMLTSCVRGPGALTEAVLALHPYDTPEVVALPVVGGSAPYLAWLHDATGGAELAKALEARGTPPLR
jgi:periplasmic divalent cation tolerance protein